MRPDLDERGGWPARWADRARRVGLLLLVLAACAVLGLALSLPLWLFATSAPRLYTLIVLALIGAGLLSLVVKAFVRRLAADPSIRLSWSFLAVVLTCLMTLIALGAAYGIAVSASRGFWVPAAASAAFSALLLWLLTLARRAARRRRKDPSKTADNGGR